MTNKLSYTIEKMKVVGNGEWLQFKIQVYNYTWKKAPLMHKNYSLCNSADVVYIAKEHRNSGLSERDILDSFKVLFELELSRYREIYEN